MNKIKNIIQAIHNKPADYFLYLIFALAFIKLYSLYFSVNVDDANWEEFKDEHNCELRLSNNNTQKASWKCDDGKIYYRWLHQR